jgi:hypothetical protein
MGRLCVAYGVLLCNPNWSGLCSNLASCILFQNQVFSQSSLEKVKIQCAFKFNSSLNILESDTGGIAQHLESISGNRLLAASVPLMCGLLPVLRVLIAGRFESHR